MTDPSDSAPDARSFRDQPLRPSLSVERARDCYLAENGFSVTAYDASWTDASFFCVDYKVPNTKNHARLLRRHDLHHVATGYGTDFVGEAELSAWELGRGLSGVGLYVGAIIASAVAVGLVIAPRRTWRALRSAGVGPSLFQSPLSYDELLGLSVEELRAHLGVPREGLWHGHRALHPLAPLATGAKAEIG